MSNALTTTTLRDLLEKQKPQIKMAIPKHLTADRLVRIIMTEVQKTPDLLKCSQTSLLGAIMQASQLGLEIGGSLGHAYLIPYKDKCQFIIGYRGMIDLSRRSAQVISLTAQCIYENDIFEFEFGINERLKHVPAKENRGNFVGAYAIARLKDGGHQFEVMWKNDIEKIKLSSAGYKVKKEESIWAKHFEEMAKKTVIRRLFKYLPVSIEMQRAIILDEQAESGSQNTNEFTNFNTGETFDMSEQESEKTKEESKVDNLIDKMQTQNNINADDEYFQN